VREPVPAVYRGAEARLGLIVGSFRRLLGRALIAENGGNGDVLAALWNAPEAIVAHGTEPDPLFFFANRAALARFETTVTEFVGMPSRLSAEAPGREERQALLDRVARDGFIDDYAGIRISARGTRFAIRDAVVWNLIDEVGKYHGQAAKFYI
jgi:hypothetical protein